MQQGRRQLLIGIATAGAAGAMAASFGGEPARASAVGYRSSELRYTAADGTPRTRHLLLWYPTAASEQRFDYDGQIGLVAANAAAAPGRHPLLLFSHGYLGAADQSIFVTEHLARMGYLVAAVEHGDARGREGLSGAGEFARPQTWTDATHADRRQDLLATLDHLIAEHGTIASFLYSHVDVERIGAIGHSLGGYSVLGLGGARPAWRDRRVRAVVALSPYVAPLLLRDPVNPAEVPVMLQGGTLDIGITPDLPALYARLVAPKYLLVLRGGHHLGWTDLASLGVDSRAAVRSGNPHWIVAYATAFFDQHLRGLDRAGVLARPNRDLESFLYDQRRRR
jgi:predicted dienelactone hydrolase